MESIQCCEAERVDATDDRGVDQSGLDHASRRAEGLRTGRACGAHRGRRSAQLEITAHEVGDRVAVVRAPVVERCGQRSGGRVPVTVGDLGLEDPRGAGADENADAVGAVALARSADRVAQPVLLERELRQPVVATVERGEIRRATRHRRARRLQRPSCRAAPFRTGKARAPSGARPAPQRARRCRGRGR